MIVFYYIQFIHCSSLNSHDSISPCGFAAALSALICDARIIYSALDRSTAPSRVLNTGLFKDRLLPELVTEAALRSCSGKTVVVT